ncbi:unnamed protein product [Sphagnum balticum]
MRSDRKPDTRYPIPVRSPLPRSPCLPVVQGLLATTGDPRALCQKTQLIGDFVNVNKAAGPGAYAVRVTGVTGLRQA